MAEWIDDKENPFVDHAASEAITTSMGATPPTDRLFMGYNFADTKVEIEEPIAKVEHQGYWSRVFYSLGVVLALGLLMVILMTLFISGLFLVPIVFGLFRKDMWK